MSRGDYMPKVKSTFKDQQNSIRKWIASGKIDKGLKHDLLAKRLSMPPSTLSYRIAHPETIRLEELWRMEKVLGKYQEF